MQVPFIDLRLQHESLLPDMCDALKRVTESGTFAGGPFVEQFESEFAAFCQSRFAVGLGSGTDALWLTLLSLGVGPGDEVITVPNGYIGVAEAISLCGARPVFVDIDERTYTLDPALLEAAITLRTQAIIPVHLFGQMADMDAILSIARRYGTPVVEDASQAHGAEYKGRSAGSMGVAGCFSFHPDKNLGAIGEAGAVTTDEVELRNRLQMLRDHGQAARHVHASVGWNSRMDAFQASVLSLKLMHLAEGNAARRQHATVYEELLASDSRVLRPMTSPHGRHVYHHYVIRVNNRNRVLQRLAARGVKCAIHYPTPIHLQKAYSFLNLRPGSFPIAERCAEQLLSLPMYPELTSDQLHFVVDMLKESLADEPEMEPRPRRHYELGKSL